MSSPNDSKWIWIYFLWRNYHEKNDDIVAERNHADNNNFRHTADSSKSGNITAKKQTEYKLLTPKELLPYIDYENAVEHGHVARVYAEEDLNTIVYKNIDGTKTAYVFDYDIIYVCVWKW